MNRVFNALKTNISVVQQKIKIPDRFKQGRFAKWGVYWKSLVEDYKTVAIDTFEESKAKPKKTVAILSSLGLLMYAIKTNPGENSFLSEVSSRTNELILVGEAIRNPVTTAHLKHIHDCINKKALQVFSLGVCTIVWEADYCKDCDLYSAQCTYLKPQWSTFHKRIIDVGFMGFWLNMYLRMIDFDVNPEEWKDR